MFIKELTLSNFRSYKDLHITFPNSTIFIIGKNGSGKTNILESLYYLSIGRSFLKVEDKNLINDKSSSATIFIRYHSDKDHTISSLITPKYKQIYFDDDKVKTLSSLLGKLLITYYLPNQVYLFKEEPSERRRILDETLSQLDSDYLYEISRYKRLLKERNSAIVQNFDIDVINVLKDQLINLSYSIIKKRKKLISLLSARADGTYHSLFANNKKLTLFYKTSCSLADNKDKFISEMEILFEKNRSIENIRRYTIIGPHRDDFFAQIDDKNLSSHGSQSENRLASLSLRLAIRDEIEYEKKEKPILLLDDILSDLDKTRQDNLLSYIKDKGQVFITYAKRDDRFKNNFIYTTSDMEE